MKIGIIGIGVIATAMVHGFCMDGDKSHEIYLSPRNGFNSSSLSQRYPNVKRMSNNQEVVDCAEYILLTMHPSIGEETVRSLNFKKTKKVINVMADTKLEDLKTWIGKDISVSQIIPMPPIAMRKGAIIIYPIDPETAELFKGLGELIQVEEACQMRGLFAITALPSTYYTILCEIMDWGEKYNIPRQISAAYTTSLFEAISILAREQKGDIKKLVDEMTPGGLNVMTHEYIQKKDGISLWIEALDRVMARIS